MDNKQQLEDLASQLKERSLALVIVETGVLVLLALTALVGNSCVLYVFYMTPRLRTVTSYYIIVLAISDVLMSVVVMPITIVGCACGCDAFGPALGEASLWIFTALVYGSLETTSLIAVNRYYCVVKPSKYKKYFSSKFAKTTVALCWVSSLVFCTLNYLIGIVVIKFHPGKYMHFPLFVNEMGHRITAASYQIIFTIIPATLAAVCYWKITKTVKAHNASISSSAYDNNTPGANTATTALSSEETHLTKSLMAIVVGFVLIWIPNSILFQLAAYMELPRILEIMTLYTTCASSAINPIVYNIFNKPFRKRLFKLVRPGRTEITPVSVINART